MSLFFILLFFLYIHNGLSCTCYPSHPQQHFCQADFVIIAQVRENDVIRESNFLTYLIKLKKIFKATNEAAIALKKPAISTSNEESACGRKFSNKKYLITGRIDNNRRLWVNLCNFVMEYSQLSMLQRRGFRYEYANYCKCKLSYYDKSEGICPISMEWPQSKCRDELSACVPVNPSNFSSLPECQWNNNMLFRKCVSDFSKPKNIPK